MSGGIGGFQKAANKHDLKEGGLFGVELNGNRIVLSMIEGKIYAMDAVCSHEGGPLEEGSLSGYELQCPWHYAVFDVRDGKVSEATVWATNQKSYAVQVDQATGDILIDLSATAATAAASNSA
jgi:nitrite reductase/ring-hydroxylating ferredoxin subunit